jgi:hypothetical protein
MVLDENLHYRARAKATGANNHAIAGIIGAIVLAEANIRNGDTSEDWQAMIDRNEAKLRAFIATGKLGQST